MRDDKKSADQKKKKEQEEIYEPRLDGMRPFEEPEQAARLANLVGRSEGYPRAIRAERSEGRLLRMPLTVTITVVICVVNILNLV